MQLPAWTTTADGELVELDLPADSVLLALIVPSGGGNGSAVAVLTPAQMHFLSGNKKKFEDWVLSLGHSPVRAVAFRWLGRHDSLSGLSEVLSRLGFQEGAHLALDPRPKCIHFLPSEGRLRIPKDKTPAGSDPQEKVRVLVVDDSETIRKLLKQIISEDPQMECVGEVANPLDAVKAIEELKPNVITLDIHMPEIDGVTLLKQIFPRFRIPAVMISALSMEDGTFVLDALEAGAVDYIQKPSFSEAKILAPVIREKIKAACFARVQSGAKPVSRNLPLVSSAGIDFSYLVAIGSSTGGTEALKAILTKLPEKIPPIVIVQHIPPVFSKAFAARMNELCPFEVLEAADGDSVVPNRVLIAPGGKQMKLKSMGFELRVSIDDSEPVNRHKPSVDVLFDSVASLNRKKIVGVILTGMGSDGAKGLLNLKKKGARTLVQDEQTSVVYGMPREAKRLGGADEEVGLERMAEKILLSCKPSSKAGAA